MDFDIRQIALIYFTILVALTVHEFAHAWVADRLGDDTPRRAGRLNLNPITVVRSHPFGALVIPLIAAAQGFMIGWAATPVNFARVRRGITVRKAAFLITVAGPVSNVLLAVLGAAALVALQVSGAGRWSEPFVQFATTMVLANVFLALFNLLPVSPLDGYTVLRSVLPARYDGVTKFLEEYSMVLFLGILIFGDRLLSPATAAIAGALVRFARWVAGT